MNKTKIIKRIVLTVYIVTIVAFCLTYSGLIEFFPVCDYYSNRRIMLLQFFVPITVFPIVGWGIALLLRIDKSSRFLFCLIIPIISFSSIMLIRYFKQKQIARTSTGIIRIAKIKDIHRGKNTHYVDVTYRKDGKRYKRDEVRFLGKSAVKTLHIGDSLLVLSVKDCDAIMYVYKPHPTLQEFKKCADYGYYFNGNLYSKEEFEGKNIE